MARPFPYTYYSCPCVDTAAPLPILTASRKVSRELPPQDEESEEEPSFDPTAPRAQFSLFPLERLLWCTECHEMRCARCTLEEVVFWYCPMCLFEVPSSTVKTEGNRCTRNCYNCPICTSPLTVNSLEAPSSDGQTPDTSGPFILACQWCNWTSLDIGINFEKHTNITGQLSRIRNGGISVPTLKEREALAEKQIKHERGEAEPETAEDSESEFEPDKDDLYFRLNAFYRNQIADTDSFGTSANIPLASPGSISRLLNLYSGKKTKRNRPRAMREAISAEGLQEFDPSTENAEIERRRALGWQGTTSTTQRAFQASHQPVAAQDLRPVAALLKTKRLKRCKVCRTLLAKPENRVTSSKWRHRVLALNNIPRVSLRPLNAPASLGPDLSLEANAVDHFALRQGTTYQFLFTAANPLFDPIRVTLATPGQTTGRVHSRVTILCPEFEVGANSDVWDEALSGGGNAAASGAVSSSSSRRKSTMLLAGVAEEPQSDTGSGRHRQAEAGKIWGKGRNWTSVIVEVVPGLLPSADEIGEDEDLLEIAVFVRFEYEAEVGDTEKMKEKKEEAFWCVLGTGKIVR